MLFVLAGTLCPLGLAADIRVRVINTQTGKPMAGQGVGLRPYRPPGDYLVTWTGKKTGPDGVAVFNLSDPAPQWVNLVVLSGMMLWNCSPMENNTFSLAEILEHGVVAKNRCESKATRKAKITATAGEVILFTRPLHWWEKAQW
jgi:hypothetical protein